MFCFEKKYFFWKNEQEMENTYIFIFIYLFIYLFNNRFGLLLHSEMLLSFF
jgi:hypothetical protein